jgi:hypothetical protein
MHCSLFSRSSSILTEEAAATIFMFGKQYLTEEQQHEMRRLAGRGVES